MQIRTVVDLRNRQKQLLLTFNRNRPLEVVRSTAPFSSRNIALSAKGALSNEYQGAIADKIRKIPYLALAQEIATGLSYSVLNSPYQ